VSGAEGGVSGAEGGAPGFVAPFSLLTAGRASLVSASRRPHAWWMDAIDVRAHRRGMRRDGAGQPEKTGAGRQASGAHAGFDLKAP